MHKVCANVQNGRKFGEASSEEVRDASETTSAKSIRPRDSQLEEPNPSISFDAKWAFEALPLRENTSTCFI